MIKKAWKEFISLTHSKEFIPGTSIVILFFLMSFALFPHTNADAKLSGRTLSATTVHPHTIPIPTITPKPTDALSIQSDAATPSAIPPTPTSKPNSNATSPANSSNENKNTSSSSQSTSPVTPIEIIPTETPIPPVLSQTPQNSQTEPTPTVAPLQDSNPTPTGASNLNQQVTQAVQELSNAGTVVGGLTQQGQ